MSIPNRTCERPSEELNSDVIIPRADCCEAFYDRRRLTK
mgnify:CR=1 FL=1